MGVVQDNFSKASRVGLGQKERVGVVKAQLARLFRDWGARGIEKQRRTWGGAAAVVVI